jgi:thiamine biosynthesis protein ThiI
VEEFVKHVLVHYHEIALKGRNRPFFIRRLVENLRAACGDVGVAEVRALPGRIVLEAEDGASWQAIRERLGAVYGVANFALAREARRDLLAVKEAALEMVREVRPASFRVSARRGDKTFPMKSPDINREVGAHIFEATQIPVRLEGAELDLRIEVLDRAALLYGEKHPGAGGLPVGVSGRVLALLSGGIDSPVAAARMMRRGCRVSFVHFHSHPYLDSSSQEKVRELAALLTRRQMRTRLHLVPFGEIQREVVAKGPAEMRVVLYRRFMVRIAERIARFEKALALCTGESIGQVASQTLPNIAVIDEVASIPILRPLVGMDKEEITREARALGTFPISILPDQDCCTLFIPRHPTVRATSHEARDAEGCLDVDALVEAGLAGAVLEEFRFPS